MEILLALSVLVLTVQVGLLIYDHRRRSRTYERIRSLRISAPEVTVADLEAVDFDTPQPLIQVPHSHVWGSEPYTRDTTSRTYRCQVPRCPRIHTVMR